ncbi:Fe-S cluster assembly transcriptional regulator IscR [Glaciecola siphonariae]|uniref:Fe-S cluster assembly transcriptional regulator IscR n=1 Tax=Glaciecola siphonariae TaxID=521012 RepID=A0ABV9LTG2_9ALTE
MKLTSKGRYAVTAMLDLALHSKNGPVSLAAISERQDISLSYLEQLFAKLRRTKLVRSVRGPGGGYTLNKEPQLLSVGAIIEAVNENIDATKCQGKADCQGGERCLTHSLWQNLSDRISDFLHQISLQELMQKRDVKEVIGRQNCFKTAFRANEIDVLQMLTSKENV